MRREILFAKAAQYEIGNGIHIGLIVMTVKFEKSVLPCLFTLRKKRMLGAYIFLLDHIDRVEKVNHFGKDLAVFRLIGLIIDGPFGLPVFGAIL